MSRDFAEMNLTKRDRVLRLLSDLLWHSHQELAQVGGVRYGARILELKRLGYDIDSEENVTNWPQGKRYRLATLARGLPQTKQVKVFLNEDDAAALVGWQVTVAAQRAVQEALASFRANKHKL